MQRVYSEYIKTFQAGLYKKWKQDLLKKEAKESRTKYLKDFSKLEHQDNKGESKNDRGMSLSTTHLQGPLLLLFLGLSLSSVIFISERLMIPTSTSLAAEDC